MGNLMKLKTGQSLFSLTDTTTLLVVKAGEREVSITCGGYEMTATKSAAGQTPVAGQPVGGAALGKRYADADGTIELLCIKSGTSELALDGSPLQLMAAKQLPASD
jgi:hypothetical protein